MGLLQALGNDQGYLKAGFLGFPKSGKTYTASILAAGTRNMMSTGPIAFFDTEGGSSYVASLLRDLSGVDPVALRSRSFDHLMAVGKECLESGIEVLLVDSITHVWRDVCESYLKERNDYLKRKGWRLQDGLEFQDWGVVKRKWQEWTDFYLNSPLHIVICGRAGFEYEFQDNDRGKKELVKTGTKMKAESEFGFEPSLLVEMERDASGDGIKHVATVIGDRFDAIDGQTCSDPTFDFFRPHVERLVPGKHAEIDIEARTRFGIDDGQEWTTEKRKREIASEEIEGFLREKHPSTSAQDKKARTQAMQTFFGTRSWTKLSKQTPSDVLERGLIEMRGQYASGATHGQTDDAVAADVCGEDDTNF